MPCTSVTCVTRRVPSRSRVSWTTTSTAEAICSRMARSGRSMPAMSTRVSRRAMPSRGELAWPVDSEPSRPVFIAWSMSRLSPPRHSPHDDPVRTHAEGVADQVADRDRALALDVRWPRLQPDDVLLLQLELDGVLDGDDPLAVRDERGQHVEQSDLVNVTHFGRDVLTSSS